MAIDHVLAEATSAGALGRSAAAHRINRPLQGQLGALPAKLVDQKLLKLFRLDSQHFRAFLLAEHDSLADELVQHDVVQNGVDVEQLFPSFGKTSRSSVRKSPLFFQCPVAGVCRARLQRAALIVTWRTAVTSAGRAGLAIGCARYDQGHLLSPDT